MLDESSQWASSIWAACLALGIQLSGLLLAEIEKKNPKWNKIRIFIMKPFSMLLHWTRFLLLLLSPLKALTQSLRHKSGLSSYFYYHFISLITFIKKQNKTKKISLSKSCSQTKSSFKAIILILKREKLQPSSRLLYVMK